MAWGRVFHTATLLPDGTVLVAGGSMSTVAEIYDPGTGLFRSISALTTPRSSHTATALSNGTVLLSGGSSTGGSTLASAEIYDPVSSWFSPAGTMSTSRYMHTATLLRDGSVAVMGGAQSTDSIHLDFSKAVLAEIYSGPSGNITASPNPCAVSGGLCTSYLGWTTRQVANAQVWVRVDNSPEVLFVEAQACGAQDCPANWIQGGAKYTFTLYDCDGANCTYTDHTGAKPMGSVTVTAVSLP
jgi:hypothetical protein